MTDNIIKFDPEKPSMTVRRERGYCAHYYVHVDEKKRMLECEKCGCWIEPFDYLLQWANRDRQVIFVKKQIETKIKELSKKLDNLKREERNIKARIRNAQKKPNI